MATWLGVSGWAVERADQLVERKRLVASVLLSIFLLLGCPATTQLITVTNNGSSLSVNGAGFSNIPQCAQLAFIGLQSLVSMGLANCSGGGFSNFNWRFGAITAPGSPQRCQFTGPQDAVVTATDLTSSEIASAKTSINWGPNCALVCGRIREPAACPAGCLEGVSSNPGGPGTCCGGGSNTTPCGEHCCANFIERCEIVGGPPHCVPI
jgi:hypothetical protein